jgi:hypothetical protein
MEKCDGSGDNIPHSRIAAAFFSAWCIPAMIRNGRMKASSVIMKEILMKKLANSIRRSDPYRVIR